MTQKTRSYGKAAALFGLFLLAQLVGSAVAFVLAHVASHDDLPVNFAVHPEWLGIGLLVAYLLLIPVLWATKLIRRPFPAPGQQARLRHSGMAIAAFVLFTLSLNVLLSPFELNDGGMEALFEGMRHNILCLLTLAIVGPVVEELVFREGIQRQLKASGLSRAASIALAALLFAIVHGNWAQGAAALLIGLILGLLYERAGDIRLSAPAHIINNSLAIGLMWFPQADNSLKQLPPALAATMGAAGCIAAAGLLWTWWRRTSITPHPPCE